jgi:hypothetical protein
MDSDGGPGTNDEDMRLGPIAINMEALHFYIDVLQMLRRTDGAAMTERRDAWRAELTRLRELTDAAADARGEWECDDCGHHSNMWSYGDVLEQWV